MVLTRNTNSWLQVDAVGDICAPAEILGVSPGIGGLFSCSHRLQRNGQEYLLFPNGDDDDPDDDDFEDDDFDEEEDIDEDDDFYDDNEEKEKDEEDFFTDDFRRLLGTHLPLKVVQEKATRFV